MNRKRLFDQMDLKGIDVLIASTPVNVKYLTKYWALTQQIESGIQTYAILSKNIEKPILIAPVSDVDLVDFHHDMAVIPYGSFYVNESSHESSHIDREIGELFQTKGAKNSTEALIRLIKEKGFESSTIGIENELSFQVLNRIKEEFPNIEIKKATDLLHRTRMIHTPDEIKKLKKSTEIIEKGIISTLNSINEGIRELDVAKKLKKEIIDQGADVGFIVIGVGTHSAHPNAQPSERILKKGDIIRFDVGCVWEDYCSDTAKTFVFEKGPSNTQKKHYSAILQGQKRGIQMVRAGASISEIFEVMSKTIRKTIPNYNRHHFGHGIGLEVHEPPIIAPNSDTVLQENMVVNIEAPYYELGSYGLQVEDTLLVKKDGNELMTTIDETLEIL